MCDFYSEIARLVTVVFMIFGYKTIRNIKTSRIYVVSLRNTQQDIQRIDQQLIQIRIDISPCWKNRNWLIPDVIRANCASIHFVATLDASKSPLQFRIETLWDQVKLTVAVTESSLSFYIFGEKLFWELSDWLHIVKNLAT
jgi:hypothetical protein